MEGTVLLNRPLVVIRIAIYAAIPAGVIGAYIDAAAASAIFALSRVRFCF